MKRTLSIILSAVACMAFADGIAIGSNAVATATSAIAIGDNSCATVSGAVAIGNGTTNTTGGVSIAGFQVLDASGNIPAARISSALPSAETDPTVSSWAKAASKPSYAWSEITGKPTIPTALSQLTADTTHRLVTDSEKSTWNGKQNALTAGTNITISDNVISAEGHTIVDVRTTGFDNSVKAYLLSHPTSFLMYGTPESTQDPYIYAPYYRGEYNPTRPPDYYYSLAADEGKVYYLVVNWNAKIAVRLEDHGVVTIPTALSQLSADATHRLVTDTEKSTWNGKQNALTAGANITISGNTISATIPAPSITVSWNTAAKGANPTESLAVASCTYYKRTGSGAYTFSAITGLTAVPTYFVLEGFSSLVLPASVQTVGSGIFRSGKKNHFTMWTTPSGTFVNFLFSTL